MNTESIKELLYKMADDALIMGHRNSEWTGIGPTLEEDIAFSSMAQDKIGHAYQLYKILHEQLGEADPDTLAFAREEKQFKSCHFVELPSKEYDFSLIRQFLFDTAEYIRYDMMTQSSFTPVAQLAVKVRGEIKYHCLHAETWVPNLAANGTEESKRRLQGALDRALPYALGIFQAGKHESSLIEQGIFAGEQALKEKWMAKVTEICEKAELTLPDWSSIEAIEGGRSGFHSEHLQPMLDEMRAVFHIDETASW